MYIGTTMDYENCVVLEFLHCLIVVARNDVLMMYRLHYENNWAREASHKL